MDGVFKEEHIVSAKLFLRIVSVGTALCLASAAYSDASMTTTFGPKQYTRTAGPPPTYTDTFDFCGTAPSQIVVINGDASGKHRISSASVFLNGKQIVRPRDFNQKIDKIVKPVVLADQNQLTITLASKPGSFVTVAVQSLASPAVLTAGYPRVSVLGSATLLSALPVINTGTAPAQNVQTTAIALDGGATLTAPVIPYSQGAIPAHASAILEADFNGSFVLS